MAKPGRFGLGRRMLNALASRLAARGRGLSSWYLLSVPGRKTGLVRSTPLVVMELGDRRYLVAVYGAVDWVTNVRAADEVTLGRGGRSETFRATEVDPAEAAPVLREYLRHIRVARPYFDVNVDSPEEAFAMEASRHPVVRLHPQALASKPG
jgi:deazaflavin-dependent oxidoreductase (nitroreductase family)